MTILITGVAGFIGSFTAKALLARGETVIGVDNLNSYYDVELKKTRLSMLRSEDRFSFHELSIADPAFGEKLARQNITKIIHLAAQAGVRHSIDAPRDYAVSNLSGFTELLELARTVKAQHIVYASSSSIYGGNLEVPFSEDSRTDHPVSFYGATKKANEAMAYSYASLYKLPLTGLRFFTVYGPLGRPDMAYMIFARKMMAGEPIELFGQGEMSRDFTYIDDCVAGIIAALNNPPTSYEVPHRIFNLGNDQPEKLGDFVGYLEEHLGVGADKRLKPMQLGDVRKTWANIDRARTELGYAPKTALRDGLKSFVDWYKDYYSH